MSKPKRPKLEDFEPVLADEITGDIPLTKAYVATIKDPKTMSKCILKLNDMLPIPELQHLKRVRGRQVLLCLLSEMSEEKLRIFVHENQLGDLLDDVGRIVTVAQVAPKVRKQFNTVNELWSCNFHPNPHLEKLSTNSVFSDSEMQKHELFMGVALEACRITKTRNSTIIVDSTISSIVGIGFSQIDHSAIQHSVMVAIDDVAIRQKGGVWARHHLYDSITDNIKNKFDLNFGFGDTKDGPYLCTGCYVYTVQEPCITCSMALVHSRAKRVFYGLGTSNGGLGSLCKIHCVESLNHHYEVFKGLLANDCRNFELEDL